MAKKASKKSSKKVAKAPGKKTAATKKTAKKAATKKTDGNDEKKAAPRRAAALVSPAKVPAKVPAKAAAKAAPKAPEAAEAPRSPVARPASKRPRNLETRIFANVDVGFGNRLFVRGEGAELRWDRGLPMNNAGGSRWTFATSQAAQDLEVKFLINDEEWSQGDNVRIPLGEETSVAPTF